MEMKSFIYIIKDPISKEIRYVGQTCKGKQRFKQHVRNCNRKQPISCYIKSLLLKNLYPEFEIIDYCDINELDEKEIYYISYYKKIGCNLLNLTDGGKSIRGFKMPRDIIEKIRIQKIGRKLTEEHKRNISKNSASKSPEARKRMSETRRGKNNSFYGKTHSEITKLKLGKDKNGNNLGGKNKRSIICLNTGEIFESANHAAKVLNLNPGSIRSVLRKKAKAIKGYRFDYV